MPASSGSVTVTVLPDVLALVHIPRSRLKNLSHHVVKQILTPSPSFLNITSNKIELSLFAHKSILAEFEPLARKDRLRNRRSATYRLSRSRSQGFRKNDPVEVSYDTWNVLQIDSHDDRLDRAGARVRELSAPLAEAGLSVLYQSSYMSDFLFVKSSRLDQALSRLAQAGFVEYPFDLSSQILPPSTNGQDDDDDVFSSSDSQSDSHRSDSVGRRRSSEVCSISLVLQRDEILVPNTQSPVSETAAGTPTPPASNPTRRTSISPCAGDVKILDPALACVGLSDACADTWASKIIKLVAYPELISSAVSSPSKTSAHTDVADPEDTLNPVSPLCDSEIDSTFDKSTTPKPAFSEPFSQDAWSSFASISDSASSFGTSSSSSEEDGYFSSASFYSTFPSTPSLISSHSYPELSDSSSSFSPPVHYRSRPRLSRLNTMTEPMSSAPVSTVAEDPRETAVPFFSFTRTAEGSSLTTTLSLIATLFPPSERHMVICGDELGMADEDGNGGWGQFQSGAPSPVSSTMKCLQIDLQRYGLEKHGLISRFSKVLDSNGINHMYNSTYKTANLLVDKADAVRAQSLLRIC